MMRRIAAIVLATLLMLPPQVMQAGTLLLRDGKRMDGEVRFTTEGQLAITPEGTAKEQLHALEAVQTAVFSGKLPRSVDANSKRPNAEWTLRDIGNANKPAVMGAGDKRITLRDFSGGVRRKKYGGDSIAFIGQRLEGDGEITARVIVTEQNNRARAGVMIRETLFSEARYVAIVRSVDTSECVMQVREERTDMPEVVGETQKPILGAAWLRLTRAGDKFTAAESVDGKKWTVLGEKTLPLVDGRGVFIGLFASGTGAENVTYFDGVVASGKRSTITEIDQVNEPVSGVVLRSGTLIAGNIERVDAKEVRIRRTDNEQISLNPASVSRVFYASLSEGMRAKVERGSLGIMLQDGDFVDGELKEIDGDRISVSSVVFGITQIERRQVAAVILRPLAVEKLPWVVKMADGSEIRAKSVKLDKDRLVLDEPRAGEVRVLVKDVLRVDSIK